MRGAGVSTLAALVFVAWASSGAAQASEVPQGSAERVTNVDVGNDSGEPGDRVSLPIILKAPDGVRVGTTINEVTFPAKVLAFEEALAENAQVEVSATVKRDGENAESSILQITATGKQGAVLPNGLVATAVFRISKDASGGPPPITLKNVPRALTPGAPGRPIDQVAGSAGEVEVIGPPAKVFACFFYMH